MTKLLTIFEGGVVPAPADREGASRHRSAPGSWADAFKAFAVDTSALVNGPAIASTVDVYRNSPTARACLEVIAATLAQLPFDVYRSRGLEDIEKKLGNHPLTKLIKRPNNALRMSKFSLLYQSWLLYETFGEVFWLTPRTRPGALPKEIWLYHPWAVQEIYHPTTGQLLSWYMQGPSGMPQFVDPADVVHIPRYDPTLHQTFRPSRGTSALQSAGLISTADIAMQRHNLGFFSRGLAPGGVIQVPGELGMTAEEFIAPIRAKLLYKPHEPIVLDEGATWTNAQTTPREAEFSTTREKNSDEIASALHVPKFLIGSVGQYHNENSKSALRSWWVTWLLPQIESFCTQLDNAFFGMDEELSCWLSTDGVEELQQSSSEKMDSAKKLFDMTVPVSQIEKKLKLGIEPYEGWDIPWRSFNLVAVTAEDANPPEPQPAGTLPPPKGGVIPDQAPPAQPLDSSKPKQATPDKPLPEDLTKTKGAGISVEAFARSLQVDMAVRDSLSRDSMPSTADHAINTILTIIRGDDGKLQTLARGYHLQALETGAQQIADLVNVEAVIGINSPRVTEFLANRDNQIVSVNETTAKKIVDTIRAMSDAGETPETIADAIRSVYNLRASQADLIGRQEVGSALSGGRFMQMQEERISQHEWLSARDERVREDHAAEDGSVVAIGETFPVTGLEYPQDPNGDPDEVINCRCITLPVLDSGRSWKGGTRVDDRTKYWRAQIGQVSGIETQMARKVKRYFFDQRSRVLKALAESYVGA